MDSWNLTNEIERISFRLDSVKAIIEMVAERVTDNPESSALWGCSEMLEVYIKQLEGLSGEAMDIHKQSKVAEEEEEERMLVDPEFGVIARFKEKIKKGKK
jgi:hypothetical protein